MTSSADRWYSVTQFNHWLKDSRALKLPSSSITSGGQNMWSMTSSRLPRAIFNSGLVNGKRHHGAPKFRFKGQLKCSLLQAKITTNVWETISRQSFILAKSNSLRLFQRRKTVVEVKRSQRRARQPQQHQPISSPALSYDQSSRLFYSRVGLLSHVGFKHRTGNEWPKHGQDVLTTKAKTLEFEKNGFSWGFFFIFDAYFRTSFSHHLRFRPLYSKAGAQKEMSCNHQMSSLPMACDIHLIIQRSTRHLFIKLHW